MRADHDTDPSGPPAVAESDETAHATTNAHRFAMADEQTIPERRHKDTDRAPNPGWMVQRTDDGELTSKGVLAASVHLGPRLPPKSTDRMLPTESVIVLPRSKQSSTVPMARLGPSRTPVLAWSPRAVDPLAQTSTAPAPRMRRSEREVTTAVPRRIQSLSGKELAMYIVVAVVFATIGSVLLARFISSVPSRPTKRASLSSSAASTSTPRGSDLLPGDERARPARQCGGPEQHADLEVGHHQRQAERHGLIASSLGAELAWAGQATVYTPAVVQRASRRAFV